MQMQNIDLGKAISIWLSGQKLDGMSIYGISVVVIGRAAKTAAYVAAFVAVLDIIGSKRIREFGDAVRAAAPRWVSAVCIALMAVLFVTAFVMLWRGSGEWPVVTVIGTGILIGYQGWRIIEAIGKLLARPVFRTVAQIGSFSVLTVAFLLDLLTS